MTLDVAVNGGDCTDAYVQLTADGKLPSTLPVATSTANTFIGWFSQPTGGEQVLPGAAIAPGSTIYAQFDYKVGNNVVMSDYQYSRTPAQPAMDKETAQGIDVTYYWTDKEDGFAYGDAVDAGNEWTAGAPVYPGTYYIRAKVSGEGFDAFNTNQTVFHVIDREPRYEITVEANSDTFAYDGTEKSVSGFKTLEFTLDGVTYTVSGLTAAASGTEIADYTAAVTGTAVVKDSEGHDLTAQFTVNKVDGTLSVVRAEAFTATVTANGRTYDGTEQPLVNVDDSTLVGGEMRYALSADGTAPNASAYTAEIPAAADTGTYTVYYKLVPDEHHNSVAPQAVTVKISADYTALLDAIADAAGYHDTIKDTYADIASALQNAIDAAQVIADNADASQSMVNEAAEILNSARTLAENNAAFEVSKAAGVLTALSKALAGDSEEVTALIEAAKAAIEALAYDEAKTPAENDARIDEILTQLDADLAAQRDAEKAAFEEHKAEKKAEVEALAQPGDSEDAQQILSDAAAAIEALAYDEAKTPAANNAAVDAIANLADAKHILQNTIDDARAFYDVVKNNEDYAEVANAVKTAIERAETALSGDDPQTARDAASDLEAALATAKADNAAIDCPYCGKMHNGNLFDRIVGFVHRLIVVFRNLFFRKSPIC